jgi:hypothetical protein
VSGPRGRGPARALLLGGAAILAAAIAVILLMSDGGSGADPGAATGAAPAAIAGRPAAPPAPAVPASAGLPSSDAPAAPAGPKDWPEVPLAVRLSDLGPLARDVYDGLQRARAAMDPCFAADEQDAAAHPRAANQEDAWGAAIVTLQLEGRPGKLVVVNAPLQELHSSSMSLVECCEKVLRGFEIPSAAAVPGKRYRLQHQLTQ